MILALAPVLAPDLAHARSTGITGRATIGCSCHAAAADATTTVTFGGAPATVLPGEVVAITLTVSSTNATRVAAGLDVRASAGTLGAGSNTIVSAGEITHAAPQSFVGGSVTFDFTWTAPAANGIYTLEAAGNAVNGNGLSSGDGWNFAADLLIEVDNGCDDLDNDGVDVCNGDCDDADPAVNPLAAELCDGVDNDCDVSVDEDPVDGDPWYLDADRDGWGAGPEVRACAAPFDHVGRAGDCDDGDAAVNPDATEVCDAGDVDQDCDGAADDATAVDATAWYRDLDHDGYGAGPPTVDCEAPPDSAALAGDCDDGDPRFNPGAAETDCADPTDWNCDGSTGFADGDLDGFAACEECDDADATDHPGAAEVCDGDDDDCDGSADEADAIDATTWYYDGDLDGHGAASPTQVACAAPQGYAAAPDDCADDDPGVHPDAAEVWYDGVDQDCDGNDDDQDGDGVPSPDDCLDTDPGAYPGAEDVPYDGVDRDCAGDDDFDQDGDGHAAAPPFGPGDDCDDVDDAVYPGAADPPCDEVDLDCDPAPDVDPTCAEPPTTGGATGGTDAGKEGCGCAAPTPAPGAALLLVGLALSRRRR